MKIIDSTWEGEAFTIVARLTPEEMEKVKGLEGGTFPFSVSVDVRLDEAGGVSGRLYPPAGVDPEEFKRAFEALIAKEKT